MTPEQLNQPIHDWHYELNDNFRNRFGITQNKDIIQTFKDFREDSSTKLGKSNIQIMNSFKTINESQHINSEMTLYNFLKAQLKNIMQHKMQETHL